jgi:hypothetical protein
LALAAGAQVDRGRDTKLDRDVAIKVLPDIPKKQTIPKPGMRLFGASGGLTNGI